MPTQADKFLYKNAVNWINENHQDNRISADIKRDFLGFDKLSPEKKRRLINTLFKETALPEVMTKSLPYLTFNLVGLPGELYSLVHNYLNESDARSLASVSKKIHSFLQGPQRLALLGKFLQRVAYGEQDKVELLFTEVYTDKAGNRKEDKIQKALLYQGKFTDYSGRTFNFSAYEYAYWAKDTHMCRMLERYMNDATKAEMLARVNEIERTGLSYIQHDAAYCTHHFDLTPLIQVLKFFVDNYDAWYAERNWAAMEAAWLNVGLAQRDVPAHVAQEYCRPDRAFNPCPPFNEPALPRILTFLNWTTKRDESWFPLTSSNSGLGFDFALMRGTVVKGQAPRDAQVLVGVPRSVDLAAVSRLDEVRTVELTQSREHLNPPAMAQGMRG